MKPKVVIMCGLPFAGKTTLSQEIGRNLGYVRVSFDEKWQQMVKDGMEVNWESVTLACEEEIRECILKGENVCYDNLAQEQGMRDSIKQKIANDGGKPILVYVKISEEEARRRREGNVKTKKRHNPSDGDFERALDTFEPPREEEQAIVFEGGDYKKWVQYNLCEEGGNKGPEMLEP